jgi:ribosome recycling factor
MPVPSMKKSLEALGHGNFNKIRTGRAHSSILDGGHRGLLR